MRKEYDFSAGRRGPVVAATKGKTRITIRIDEDLIEWFREQVDAAGGGNYQTMINEALRAYIQSKREPFEAVVRRLVKDELRKAKATRSRKGQKAA